MPTTDVRAQFESLKAAWKEGTRFLSSFMTEHWAYQAIIKLGMPVVPILLEEMRDEPDWWSPALTSITGENPCTQDMAGRLDLISQAWVSWGLERGILK